MALYHCTNLVQIAVMFEGKSDEAWQQVSQATTVRRSNELKAIAQTWKNAANILRDTEIHS